MKRIARATVVAALIAAPVAAHGQSSNNLHFNIAAGASLPTGTFGDAADVGYNLTVGLGMKQPASQLGFRVEGMYNEWNVKGLRTDFSSHVGGVSGNVTFDLNPATSVTMARSGNTLYAIGGLGYFGTGGSSAQVGWNAGGGFRFPLTGFSAYVEARYHAISNDNMKFIPIVFGLVF